MHTKRFLVAALLAGSAAAQAATVFSDNFDTETPGANVTPSNFTVASGSVDIIGSGFLDFLPGNGDYIDLDGSTSAGGTLTKNFMLTGGTLHTAMFNLAGSQRGDTNIVDVRFGTTIAAYTLLSGDPFGTRSLLFTPGISGTYTLSIGNQGGDNFGALLDRVSLTDSTPSLTVPEPQSIALLLASLGAMGAVSRRRAPRA